MLVEIRRKTTTETDTGRLLTGRERNLSQIANPPAARLGPLFSRPFLRMFYW